ncbi:MAG: YgiT-type zinc finger protein [Chloroflexota bacterium]
MIGEPGNDRCYFCGGRLVPSRTMLPFVVGNSVVVVKNVPAEVCTQCGEAVVDSQVASVLDTLLKQTQQTGFEVSIIAYEQIAPPPALLRQPEAVPA